MDCYAASLAQIFYFNFTFSVEDILSVYRNLSSAIKEFKRIFLTAKPQNPPASYLGAILY